METDANVLEKLQSCCESGLDLAIFYDDHTLHFKSLCGITLTKGDYRDINITMKEGVWSFGCHARIRKCTIYRGSSQEILVVVHRNSKQQWIDVGFVILPGKKFFIAQLTEPQQQRTVGRASNSQYHKRMSWAAVHPSNN